MFDEKLNSVDDEQVDVVDQQQDDDEINDVSDEKQKKQSSKENSRQRQKRISLEAEIKRLKEENDELKNLREENNALIKAANGFGFEGNDGSSLALAMEAQQRDMSIEELMLEKQLKEQEINDQVEKNPKFIKAMKDSETLSQMLADMKASETLQKLQKIDPDLKSIDDLDESFAKLVEAGVDEETAYFAVKAQKEYSQKDIPDIAGAVNSSSVGEKDYYTPEEVDRLSEKDLDDPNIWEKVRKSMTKWKK